MAMMAAIAVNWPEVGPRPKGRSGEVGEEEGAAVPVTVGMVELIRVTLLLSQGDRSVTNVLYERIARHN